VSIPTLPLVAGAAVLAIGMAYTLYGGAAANRRRQEMAALAARRGFTFSESPNYELGNEFSVFRPLDTGEDKYAYNVIKGTISNRDIFAFDYHYQTCTHVDRDGVEHAYQHGFSAVIVSSGVPLKFLMIRPRGFLAAAGEALGDKPIEFESTEFNERYQVSAVDRRWAFDVLQPRAIALLLDAPLFHIEFDYNGVIAYPGSGSRLTVPEMDAAINLLVGLLDGLPEYLVKQQRGES